MAFSQAIANPVDMMTAITFMTMGGVCERFPDARFVFLEANGGWIVPWLERLDHHAHEFPWDMPGLTMKPSAYFRRQCYISFDPDESTLPLAATSPLSAPTASCGRRTSRTPTPSTRASPKS